MLAHAGAEGFLRADGGQGGKGVGGLLQIAEAPVDDFLGVAVAQLILFRGEEMVHERRGAPQADGFEHTDGAEELGFRLHAVDLGAGAFHLLQDGVAIVNAPVNALIHRLRAGLGGGHNEVTGIAELVGVVGNAAAADQVVVAQHIQEDVVLDTHHVVIVRTVYGGNQLIGFRIAGFGIIGTVVKNAFLRDVELAFAGDKAESEQ